MTDQDTSNPTDAERNLTRLLEKHKGDAMSLAAQLLSENAGLREDRRTLTSERDALKAKVPAEGAIVLTGDDAKAFTDLTAKVPLKDLPTRLGEAEAATGKLRTLERQALFRQAADAHGMRPSVLERLAGPDLTLELTEVEKDGKKVPVARVKDADGTLRPLDEYARAAWADFLPALKADQQHAAPQAGTSFVAQRGAGDPPRGPKPKDEQIKERLASEGASM